MSQTPSESFPRSNQCLELEAKNFILQKKIELLTERTANEEPKLFELLGTAHLNVLHFQNELAKAQQQHQAVMIEVFEQNQILQRDLESERVCSELRRVEIERLTEGIEKLRTDMRTQYLEDREKLVVAERQRRDIEIAKSAMWERITDLEFKLRTAQTALKERTGDAAAVQVKAAPATNSETVRTGGPIFGAIQAAPPMFGAPRPQVPFGSVAISPLFVGASTEDPMDRCERIQNTENAQ